MWSGDQLQSREHINSSISPDRWYRSEYFYDCPEGIPAHRRAPDEARPALLLDRFEERRVPRP